MKRLLTIAGLALAAVTATAQQPWGIDKIVPINQQLGSGWASNRVVVLVDPLSSPSIVTNANEGPGWLKIAQNAVGKNGREAYAVLRYCQESNSVLVWINRFKTRDDIRQAWGRAKDTIVTIDEVPNLGEEARFYQRDGLHNNIAFCRDSYLIEVEGVGAPVEKLKQMAAVLDGNLVKALGLPTPKGQQPDGSPPLH